MVAEGFPGRRCNDPCCGLSADLDPQAGVEGCSTSRARRTPWIRLNIRQGHLSSSQRRVFIVLAVSGRPGSLQIQLVAQICLALSCRERLIRPRRPAALSDEEAIMGARGGKLPRLLGHSASVAPRLWLAFRRASAAPSVDEQTARYDVAMWADCSLMSS